MKNFIYAFLVTASLAFALSSCTDEEVAPKGAQGSASSGSSTDVGKY